MLVGAVVVVICGVKVSVLLFEGKVVEEVSKVEFVLAAVCVEVSVLLDTDFAEVVVRAVAIVVSALLVDGFTPFEVDHVFVDVLALCSVTRFSF